MMASDAEAENTIKTLEAMNDGYRVCTYEFLEEFHSSSIFRGIEVENA
jgi:hypothetical protein